MFKKNPSPFPLASSAIAVEVHSVDSSTGAVVSRLDKAVKKLPPADNYRLKDMLEAKLPIDKVNPLIKDSVSIDFDSVSVGSESVSSEDVNNEVNNDEE